MIDPVETVALGVLEAMAPLMPKRVKPLLPKLVNMARMALNGDPIPADYLQGLLDLGEADLQGQAAVRFEG